MNISDIPFLPAFIKNKLKSRNELEKIATNFSWLLYDKVSRVIVGIFVYTFVARYLGPDKLGQWNYALAFTALFGPLTTLGLNRIVVKEIVRNPEMKNQIVGSTFVLKLFGGIATFVFSLLTAVILKSDDSYTILLIGIVGAGYVFQSLDTIDLYFQSQVKSKFVVIAKNGSFIIVSVAKVFFVFSKLPLEYFVITTSLEFLLNGIFMLITYRYDKQFLKNCHFAISVAKSLLHDSWPLILSSVSILLQGYIDQIMLGDMIGNEELGQYSAALKLINVMTFFSVIIQNSVMPEITRTKQISEDLYYKKLFKIYQLMFVLFLAIGLPTVLFSDFIIVLLYGEAYKYAGTLLALLVIRLIFANFGVARTMFITNNNLFKYSLIVSATGSVINIVSNYLLIPEYKSAGAIWATILSFSVTIFIIDGIYYKTRRNFKMMIRAIFDIREYLNILKNIKEFYVKKETD